MRKIKRYDEPIFIVYEQRPVKSRVGVRSCGSVRRIADVKGPCAGHARNVWIKDRRYVDHLLSTSVLGITVLVHVEAGIVIELAAEKRARIVHNRPSDGGGRLR